MRRQWHLFPSLYEMAVYWTPLSRFGALLLIILDILSSGLRHYWIAHIPHRWILAVGSTALAWWMVDRACWSWSSTTMLPHWQLQVPGTSWELVCTRLLQLLAPNLELVNIFIFLWHPTVDASIVWSSCSKIAELATASVYSWLHLPHLNTSHRTLCSWYC